MNLRRTKIVPFWGHAVGLLLFRKMDLGVECWLGLLRPTVLQTVLSTECVANEILSIWRSVSYKSRDVSHAIHCVQQITRKRLRMHCNLRPSDATPVLFRFHYDAYNNNSQRRHKRTLNCQFIIACCYSNNKGSFITVNYRIVSKFE